MNIQSKIRDVLRTAIDYQNALRDAFPEFVEAVRERVREIRCLRLAAETIERDEREWTEEFKRSYIKEHRREWIGPVPKRGGEVRTPEPEDFPPPDKLAVMEYERYLRERAGVEDPSAYTQHLSTGVEKPSYEDTTIASVIVKSN